MALTLTHVDRGLNAAFQQGLKAEVDSRLMALAMPVNSVGRAENYGWLENIGSLKEVIDEVTIEAVEKSNYSLTNKTFAKAIQVRRDDLDDDQVGGAMTQANNVAVRGRLFPQKLIMDAIIAGAAAGGECYDGQYFFDTDHATGASGTQSNKLAGTGVTVAQIEADLIAAKAAMLNFKDAAGEPIYESDFQQKLIVVCPPAILHKFQQLANSAYISQTDNILKGTFEPVASPRLTDANDWYLFDVGNVLKPLVLQNRAPLELERLQQNSEMSVLKEKFVWKARWRGAVGYGFWQMAVKTTNT